ncbi:helix-turn-helix domain-containing protein [Xenorhabdus sp. PR6a]|nr:helix-turn-helix domain-containing protein [Xenorhabdus sp. PR6a]MDC9583066.1 helix-turn-helix domain-containing protein [Xenorhabdus sp. PR6a]
MTYTQKDWHQADIIAALRKRGTNFCKVLCARFAF